MIKTLLSVAHELTRMLFAFRKDGLLETVGPAGALYLALCILLVINAPCGVIGVNSMNAT